MRIAVINEVSAAARNADILAALAELPEAQVHNLGMQNPAQQPALTYIHTGLMAALALDAGLADMVIGGCGTGQGFLNSAMQYPGVFCGLLLEPLDAWLFSQINGGNCVSLALNKGYGWAADLNLKRLVRELFRDAPGGGYPPARSESQRESRLLLQKLSAAAHKDMADIVAGLNAEVAEPIVATEAFMALLNGAESDRAHKLAALLRQAAQHST